MTIYARKPRDFHNPKAVLVLDELRKLFRKQRGKAVNVNDVSAAIKRTPRQTREYLNYLHKVTQEIYIKMYQENESGHGKKLPAYAIQGKAKKYPDACKWWVKE